MNSPELEIFFTLAVVLAVRREHQNVALASEGFLCVCVVLYEPGKAVEF